MRRSFFIVLILAIVVLMPLVSCGMVDESIVDLPNESIVVISSEEFENLHDRFLLYGGILSETWNDAEQLRPEFFPTYFFFYYLHNIGGLFEKYEDGFIPQDKVESMVQSHFNVSVEFLRSGRDYCPEREAYEFHGIGSAGYIQITRAEQDGAILTIYYDMISATDELAAQGIVVIELSGDDFRYLSNYLTRFDD